MRGKAVGSSSQIVNPILVYAEGNLHVALRGVVGTSSAWHYDEQNDVLMDNGNSTSGMASNIRNQLGDYPVGGSRQVGSITKEMIVARFL